MEDGRMYALLDRGSLLMWPKRSAQELLFDLGERKTWDEAQRREAVASCAAWWSRWGVGPKNPQTFEKTSWSEVREILQPFIEKETPPTSFTAGVAKDIHTLANLTTSAPKTLANSLKGGLQSDRVDHLWLLCLARYIQQPLPKGFLYHQRSIAHLNEALDVCDGHLQIEQMDTADAMLLFNR